MNRFYYGWYIVAFAVVCQMVLVGATLSSFGLYVVPVSAELSLSRADMNTVLVLMNLGGAAIAPFSGWIVDRYPLRRLLILGGLVSGVALAALGLSHSILISAIVIAVLITSGQSLATLPGSALIVRWFQAHRGRALTLGAFGLSLGSIVGAPVVGQLIESFGWRMSLIICGVAAAVIVVVPSLLLRIQPTATERASEGLAVDDTIDVGGVSQVRPLAVGSLLRMPQFWFIGLAIAIPMAVSQSVLVSMVPMAIQHGIATTLAATLVSASGLMAIASKVVLSVFADRINRTIVLASLFLIAAAENVVLFIVAIHAPFPVLLGCAVVQGLTSGMLMPVWTALVAERFGPRSYATVFGLMYPIILIMCAVLVRMTGEVYDRTGSYQLAFAAFVILEVIAAALMFSVRFTRSAASPDAVPLALQPETAG